MLWDGEQLIQRHSTDDRYDFDEQRIKNNVKVFPLQGTKSLLGYFLIEREREPTAPEHAVRRRCSTNTILEDNHERAGMD